MSRRTQSVKDDELPLSAQELIIEADELDDTLADLPSEETKIAVYRMGIGNARPKFIRSYSIDHFSPEELQQNHGGGKFQLVIKSPRGREKRIIEIEGDPIFSGQKINGVQQPGIIFPQPRTELEMMREEIKELKDRLASNPQSQLTVVEMIKLVRDIMPNTQTLEDQLLAKLAQFKQLFGGGSGVESSALFEAMKKGMELVTSGEAAANGSPWIALVERAMPIVQGFLTQAAQAQAQRQAYSGEKVVQATSEKIEPLPVPPPSPIEPPTGFMALAPKLQPFIPTFVQSAASGADPTILAELAISNIESNQIETVIAWLESEQWLSDLVKLAPAIQLQHGWWQGFRDALLEELKRPVEGIAPD